MTIRFVVVSVRVVDGWYEVKGLEVDAHDLIIVPYHEVVVDQLRFDNPTFPPPYMEEILKVERKEDAPTRCNCGAYYVGQPGTTRSHSAEWCPR